MTKTKTFILLGILIIGIILFIYFVFPPNGEEHINVYDYYSGEERENVLTEDMIYLWSEDAPTITNYTENNQDYFDDPDFHPFLTVYDVPEGVKVKGAMLVSPGGAFIFRSEINEGSNVAEEFAKLGYVSFVVHYRLNPYTEEESGIDIARAIKYVRYHASDYGMSPDAIYVVGFSAGGIANGHAVLEFGENTNGSILDEDYTPDEIDNVSATPNAVIMAYSFYGRLSVADLNASTFENFNLPPTYYVYGTKDPFYNQFNSQVALLQDLNKNIEVEVLENYPHGFGATGNWINHVDNWLDNL